jgi:hypothetical protein
MTDQEFFEQFEQGTLPGEFFHHRDHVRMAFLYLTRYPALEAVQRFCDALQRFAAANGKPHLYHETISWAYLFLIRERLARAERQLTWQEFSESNADVLVWKDGALSRYYCAETLASELARRVFVLPDKSWPVPR